MCIQPPETPELTQSRAVLSEKQQTFKSESKKDAQTSHYYILIFFVVVVVPV